MPGAQPEPFGLILELGPSWDNLYGLNTITADTEGMEIRERQQAANDLLR